MKNDLHMFKKNVSTFDPKRKAKLCHLKDDFDLPEKLKERQMNHKDENSQPIN